MAAPGPSPYADSSPVVQMPFIVADSDLTAQPEHRAEVVERGSFARAVCTSCDWTGPARRARAFAVTDIEEHRLLGGAPVTIDLRDRG